MQRLVAGLATVGLLGALAPVATAAQQPALPPADDTLDVGPSIEDHLVDRLDDRDAARLRDLDQRAERDGQRRGRRDGTARADKRGRKGRDGHRLPTSDLPPSNPGATPEGDATTHPLVGQTREWLGLDDTQQTPGNYFGYYPKQYRLAAVGEHIELWVAVGDNASYDPDTGVYSLPFASDDDCRNTITHDGQTRTDVTPAQLNQLVADFDQNMYPLETEAFATPPSRNGDGALWNGVFGPVFGEKEAGSFSTEGGGGRTVTLIDNVRDDAYYTSPDEEQLSYIAGFFSPLYNLVFDRNVMTVDAYDWLHRTGANPPDDASEDPCTGAAARPFLYEGTFAHEWQHLLQSYVGESTNWINEGLSDWAQTLTGYEDPSQQIDEPEYDSHIQCFTGFLAEKTPYNQLPRGNSGPENSLTWWQDQGPGEILCDYGAAYTFMEYTAGQFGIGAMSQLFADPANGLESLQDLLGSVGDDRSSQDYLHDWAAMVALDGALDANRGKLKGGDAYAYATPTLQSSINWDEDDAYASPGAPPNGSDYVRLRDDAGAWLSGRDVDSLTFQGAETTNVDGTGWTSVDDAGDAVLWSGAGNLLDSQMAIEASIPETDPTLSMQTLFDIEYGWDFGFVQVSTDEGESWTSLANDVTTSEANGDADPLITKNLPGITGTSVPGPDVDATNTDEASWVDVSFDLSDYAGQDVLLGFRYMTDAAAVLPGWYVDDVAVGGQVLLDGSSLEDLRSYEEVFPPQVAGWHLTLIGYDADGRKPAAIVSRDVAPGESLTLGKRDLRDVRKGDVVAAIVTQDEPTEAQLKYAPYELTVGGVVQPGGS